jgi:U4/U6.U5 tri-snRNP-associated protein 2
VKELKELLKAHGRSDLGVGAVEKSELVEVCINFVAKSLPDLLSHKYDLVANITHTIPAEVGREGKFNPLEEGSYSCHVQHKGSKQWYETQDLHVAEIMPQLIGVSESYVLIFERKGI